MQVPLPAGVEHFCWVQHLISEEPGHKLLVTAPLLQHPLEILTHAPSYPLTLQVALYEQIPVVDSKESPAILPARIPVAISEVALKYLFSSLMDELARAKESRQQIVTIKIITRCIFTNSKL